MTRLTVLAVIFSIGVGAGLSVLSPSVLWILFAGLGWLIVATVGGGLLFRGTWTGRGSRRGAPSA